MLLALSEVIGWIPSAKGQQRRNLFYGPLAKYVTLRVRMRRECRERFPHHHE